MEIEEEINSNKEPLGGEAIWHLLKDAEKVIVASGKKILEFEPTAEKEEMLQKVTGRSGKLRAPALRVGKVFFVGFNEELYEHRVG